MFIFFLIKIFVNKSKLNINNNFTISKQINLIIDQILIFPCYNINLVLMLSFLIPDKGSPKIFSTFPRYDESTPAYQSNGLKSQPLSYSE